jgi:hypothetical protein
VRGCVNGEGQGEIRAWEPTTSTLGPLDEPECPRPCPLAKSERLELGRIAEAVEIDVKDRQATELVQLEERVGGTADRCGGSERPEDATREGGFSGTELTREIEHCKLTRIRAHARELSPERLGLLGRVSPDVHEGG